MLKKFTPEGYPDNIGKKGKLIDPGGKHRHFIIIDEIRRPQKDNPKKVIYLQRLQFEDHHKNDDVELRLCYYIKGKAERVKGKWVFGQFATILPVRDFKEIIDEAVSKEWI